MLESVLDDLKRLKFVVGRSSTKDKETSVSIEAWIDKKMVRIAWMGDFRHVVR